MKENRGYEYIIHTNRNKDIAGMKHTFLRFPNLSLHRGIEFIINTISQGEGEKFTLIFTEVRFDGHVIGVKDVKCYLTSADIPSGGTQKTLTDVNIHLETTNSDIKQHYIKINDKVYGRAGEDGANDKDGIYNRNNWFDFFEQFGSVSEKYTFDKLTLGITETTLYNYCVPITWELTTEETEEE